MRIVYVVPFFTYPPQDGFSIRVWNTLQALSHRNEIDVVLQARVVSDELRVILGDMVRTVTVVSSAPRKVSGPSRSVRWNTIADVLSYPPMSFQRFGQYELVHQLGILLEGDSQVDWLICETQLTGQVGLSEKLPRVRRALVLHDLYAAYVRRKVSMTPWRPYKAKFAMDLLKVRHYETTIIRQFDLITVVSPVEELEVRARVPGARIALVPNGVDVERFQPGEASLGVSDCLPSRRADTILFLGNLSYEPNQDAVRYFLADIWPLIRRARPTAHFVLAGKDPPPWMRQVHEDGGHVTVTGTVDDVRPLYRAAGVVVAPIRLGGGTNLKILEALAMGTPVVTTRAGSDGLDVQDGRHLLVANTAEEFACHVVSVLDDAALARGLSQAGRSLVVDRYSWPDIMARFEETLHAG